MSERLREIRDTIVEARKTTDYDIASPRAFDHLVVHVLAALDEIIALEANRPPPNIGDMPVGGTKPHE